MYRIVITHTPSNSVYVTSEEGDIEALSEIVGIFVKSAAFSPNGSFISFPIKDSITYFPSTYLRDCIFDIVPIEEKDESN